VQRLGSDEETLILPWHLSYAEFTPALGLSTSLYFSQDSTREKKEGARREVALLRVDDVIALLVLERRNVFGREDVKHRWRGLARSWRRRQRRRQLENNAQKKSSSGPLRCSSAAA
jgi:hypothetical protein